MNISRQASAILIQHAKVFQYGHLITGFYPPPGFSIRVLSDNGEFAVVNLRNTSEKYYHARDSTLEYWDSRCLDHTPWRTL